MKYRLCLDAGNTFVKIATFEKGGDKVIWQDQFSEEKVESALSAICSKNEIEAAIVCSVTDHTQDYVTYLKEHVKHVFVMDDASIKLPLINAYGSPETLGHDRLALACGALALFPEKNSLVIAAGTALTYNAVFANKYFRGGAISPGLSMRLQALNSFTDKLPLVNKEGDAPLMGYDTETSIRSGVVNGIVAEMEQFLEGYRAQFGEFNAILTGGDSAFLGSKIKKQIFAAPDLQMIGLNSILENNVPLF